MVYDCIIAIYHFGMRIASNFNPKATLWIKGRIGVLERIEREVKFTDAKTVWIHCASLGEFEMARPIIDGLNTSNRPPRIVLTFFSPSGYEVRKTYAGVAYVFYLPQEGKVNAIRFIAAIRPDVAIFVKYDLWWHYLNAAKNFGSNLILISAQFSSNHYFFKWFGGHGRKCLAAFNHIFVVDDNSKALLQEIGITSVEVCGDTRYDRVMEIASQWKNLPVVDDFKGDRNLIVCGSTWPKDEEVLKPSIVENSTIQWIIAPHEVDEANLMRLERLFPHSVRFSRYSNQNTNVILVDSIGVLNQIYGAADLAYVGGAFDSGLHNILEAIAFGVPVVFGPNYSRFTDAKVMIDEGLAFSVSDSEGLKNTLSLLLAQTNKKESLLGFITQRTGAKKSILAYLETTLSK